MIKRDEYNIICQHNTADPGYLDGGDSANRTGIMALCDSFDDGLRIFVFENKGYAIRHPTQEPWNNPGNFTRDQLIALIAGLWAAECTHVVRRLFWTHAKRAFFCQNFEYDAPGTVKKLPDFRDPLGPSHIGHFILCARLRFLYPFLVITYVFLVIDIVYASLVKPDEEVNQLCCMVIVAGRPFKQLLLKLHPDLKGNLDEYWGLWRDQKEIGEALYAKIKN